MQLPMSRKMNMIVFQAQSYAIMSTIESMSQTVQITHQKSSLKIEQNIVCDEVDEQKYDVSTYYLYDDEVNDEVLDE